MPRRRADEVTVDPVAAAKLMATLEPGPGVAEMQALQLAVQAAQAVQVAEAVRLAQGNQVQCALGHEADVRDRFCPTCGLAMDAPAPAGQVSLEDARPKPASQLTAEESDERDRQHAEALALARQVEAAPAVYVPPEGETILIHFIEDGLTFAGQVWYRGQEIEIGPSHPRWAQAREWILLGRYEQVERWGKQFFDRGPWPGRRSYLDGADGFQQLKTEDKQGTFAGPGEAALRQADEAERRRGRAVPGPLALQR